MLYGCRDSKWGNNSGTEAKEKYELRHDAIHSRVVFELDGEHTLESMGSNIFAYNDVDTHVDSRQVN